MNIINILQLGGMTDNPKETPKINKQASEFFGNLLTALSKNNGHFIQSGLLSGRSGRTLQLAMNKTGQSPEAKTANKGIPGKTSVSTDKAKSIFSPSAKNSMTSDPAVSAEMDRDLFQKMKSFSESLAKFLDGKDNINQKKNTGEKSKLPGSETLQALFALSQFADDQKILASAGEQTNQTVTVLTENIAVKIESNGASDTMKLLVRDENTKTDLEKFLPFISKKLKAVQPSIQQVKTTFAKNFNSAKVADTQPNSTVPEKKSRNGKTTAETISGLQPKNSVNTTVSPTKQNPALTDGKPGVLVNAIGKTVPGQAAPGADTLINPGNTLEKGSRPANSQNTVTINPVDGPVETKTSQAGGRQALKSNALNSILNQNKTAGKNQNVVADVKGKPVAENTKTHHAVPAGHQNKQGQETAPAKMSIRSPMAKATVVSTAGIRKETASGSTIPVNKAQSSVKINQTINTPATLSEHVLKKESAKNNVPVPETSGRIGKKRQSKPLQFTFQKSGKAVQPNPATADPKKTAFSPEDSNIKRSPVGEALLNKVSGKVDVKVETRTTIVQENKSQSHSSEIAKDNNKSLTGKNNGQFTQAGSTRRTGEAFTKNSNSGNETIRKTANPQQSQAESFNVKKGNTQDPPAGKNQANNISVAGKENIIKGMDSSKNSAEPTISVKNKSVTDSSIPVDKSPKKATAKELSNPNPDTKSDGPARRQNNQTNTASDTKIENRISEKSGPSSKNVVETNSSAIENKDNLLKQTGIENKNSNHLAEAKNESPALTNESKTDPAKTGTQSATVKTAPSFKEVVDTNSKPNTYYINKATNPGIEKPAPAKNSNEQPAVPKSTEHSDSESAKSVPNREVLAKDVSSKADIKSTVQVGDKTASGQKNAVNSGNAKVDQAEQKTTVKPVEQAPLKEGAQDLSANQEKNISRENLSELNAKQTDRVNGEKFSQPTVETKLSQDKIKQTVENQRTSSKETPDVKINPGTKQERGPGSESQDMDKDSQDKGKYESIDKSIPADREVHTSESFKSTLADKTAPQTLRSQATQQTVPPRYVPMAKALQQAMHNNFIIKNDKLVKANMQLEDPAFGKMDISFNEDSKHKSMTVLLESDAMRTEFQKLMPVINEALQQKGIELSSLKIDVGNFNQKENQEQASQNSRQENNLNKMTEEESDEKNRAAVNGKKYGYNTIELLA